MADEAEEVNTPAEDGNTGQQLQGTEVSETEKNSQFCSGEGPDPGEKPPPASAEHFWSAPLLSFARKATETISSGVSYAATPRNPAQGAAASSPSNTLPENDLNCTSNQPGGFFMEGLSNLERQMHLLYFPFDLLHFSCHVT